LQEVKQEAFSEVLEGQTAFVWSDADAVSISKLLVDFTKKNENVSVRGGILDKVFLPKEDIKRLADLPSREVLLAQLLRTMLSPLTQFGGRVKR